MLLDPFNEAIIPCSLIATAVVPGFLGALSVCMFCFMVNPGLYRKCSGSGQDRRFNSLNTNILLAYIFLYIFSSL